MFLEKILSHKRDVVAAAKRRLPLAQLQGEIAAYGRSPRDFTGVLCADPCAVIAEIKRASPSKGRIREEFDPAAIARTYAANGAAALSVLTEDRFFEGSNAYLQQVREVVDLPLLRKDFVVDPYMIYEARALGADAVLLIVRILSQAELVDYQALSRELGMDALVEIHDEAEMERAVAAGATLIGVNNRNLSTFTTDIGLSLRLAEQRSAGITLVSESGIASRDDIDKLRTAGISAFLIGETLMREVDPGRKLRELRGMGSA